MKTIVYQPNFCSLTSDDKNPTSSISDYIRKATVPTLLAVSLLTINDIDKDSAFSNKTFFEANLPVNAFIPSKIENLEKLYYNIDFRNIREFLVFNSSLIDPLLEAKIQIHKRFGNVETKLELVQDEELENWKTLFLTISGNIERKTFNIFLKEWAFNQTMDFKKKITFTIA